MVPVQAVLGKSYEPEPVKGSGDHGFERTDLRARDTDGRRYEHADTGQTKMLSHGSRLRKRGFADRTVNASRLPIGAGRHKRFAHNVIVGYARSIKGNRD